MNQKSLHYIELTLNYLFIRVMMVDMTPAFKEAVNNVREWRTRYSSSDYPHKVVINISRRKRELWTHDYMDWTYHRISNSEC